MVTSGIGIDCARIGYQSLTIVYLALVLFCYFLLSILNINKYNKTNRTKKTKRTI